MAEQTVDTILVKIKADMTQLRNELNRTNKMVGKSVKDQKKSFSLLGLNFKTLVTGAVAIGAVQLGRSLVSVASAAEEMQGKSSVVFGQFIGDFRNFASDLAESTGRSRIELEGMGASIQDLFVPLGFSREEATGLSKTLTKLAVDVGSFNDVSDPEVMRAFQSALVGNHEAVRRFGVIITEATLKQELLRMGITKNSNEVDNATKVQARLNILMAGTTDAQGDAVRTADSFANRSRALSSAIKDLSVDVGKTLLPMLGELANNITTEVIPALRDFFKMVGLIDPTRDEKILELINQLTELRIRLALVNDKRAFKTISEDIREVEQELNKLTEARNKELKAINEKAKLEAQAKGEVGEKRTEDQKEFIAGITEEISNTQRLIEAQRLGEEQLQKELDTQEKLQELKELGFEQDSIGMGIAKELIEDKQNLINILEDEAEIQEELTKQQEKFQSIIDSTKTSEQQLTEEIREFKELADELGLTTMPQFQIALETMEHELRMLDPLTKILHDTFERAFEGIGRSITDAMVSGGNAMDNLKSVAKNVVDELLNEFFRLQVIIPLKNAIFGGGSSGGASSLISGAISGLGSFFGGSSSGLTSSGGLSGNAFTSSQLAASTSTGTASFMMGRAGGGAVQRGMPTVVGERGAELFIPNTSGRIVNNSASRGMMGGQTVINQNLNVNAGVAQTVRAEMLNLLPAFKQETIAAVAETRLRGGEFASAFSGGK